MSSTVARRPIGGIGLILLAYIAFISLGLPDGLLGVAWPSIRAEFARPLDSLGLLLISSTTGYLTSSFFSGRIMARLGVGRLLAASCFATGVALLGYTIAPSWWIIVALGLLAGSGAGAIDAGLNTYVAANYGEGLMQWLHASFGVGVTLGPIIMTGGINNFNSWRTGYIIVGTAQILLAICFFLTAASWKRPMPQAEEETAPEQRLTDYRTSLRHTLRQPSVWLSLLLFFLYTGAEVTLGQWTYSLLTEGRGISPEVAGLWAGSYWGTFTVGRIVAGLYTRRISVDLLLRVCISAAFVGAVLIAWNPVEWVSLLGIAIVGFAVAPVFPALVSGTSDRVGPAHAANTIGMQISAAGLGVAVIPGLAGVLARVYTLEIIPFYLIGTIVLLFVGYLSATRYTGKAKR
jgi:fucose permease